MTAIQLIHYFTHFTSMGGVQSMLRHHLAHDAEGNVQSSVVAFFEKFGLVEERVSGLGLTWKDTISSSRRKFVANPAAARAEVAFYHNGWGIPFMADLDRAERRVTLLHSDLPSLQPMIRTQEGLVDGFLCVNEALKKQAEKCLPQFDPDRIGVVPIPISPPPMESAHPPMQGRPIICGYSGRLIRAQKRVDRFSKFCEIFDRCGMDYRFEILGDGPERASLENQFRNNPKVRIHGRQTGDAYWNIIRQWDAILFVSDYEGLPISLLEALSLGVLPIFPRIESGGDAYVQRVSPELLYSAGDGQAAGKILQNLAAAPEDRIRGLRDACRREAEPHLAEAYIRGFSEFIGKIHRLPRISGASFRPRPFYWSDHVPYGALGRFYYDGLFKRTEPNRL